MILLERLNEIDDNEYVYLGAKEGNGFIFIGTAKDARATLNDISEDYFAKEKKRLKEAKSRLEKADEMIASLPNAILAEDDDKKREILEARLKYSKASKEQLLRYIANRTETISTFVPFHNRNVTDEYRREVERPLGKIILFDGSCSMSGYWTLKEYETGKVEF